MGFASFRPAVAAFFLFTSMWFPGVVQSFGGTAFQHGARRGMAKMNVGTCRGFGPSFIRTQHLSTAASGDTTAKEAPEILQQIIRLRGPVAYGYGRGGKKLGVPTANLPESLFADALKGTSTGVYFGWALIEDADADKEKEGRNTCRKAVVNVGYSPTFEGEENREKIVEAHLMIGEDDPSPMQPPDFYNETMRLSLVGFLRPEMKFESFPDLLSAIHNDISNAGQALSGPPFDTFQSDPFISQANKPWIGRDGGDESASWEFVDMTEA
jgi:riboflavin kinase